MDDGNRKLLSFIAVVNVLTLVLLIVFVVMSWNVVTMEKTSQQESEQQTPKTTGTPSGQQTDVVKCMQDCMKEGKQPSECESECGATSKQPPTGGTAQGKCGDGTCDEIEEEKGVCPEDCE